MDRIDSLTSAFLSEISRVRNSELVREKLLQLEQTLINHLKEQERQEDPENPENARAAQGNERDLWIKLLPRSLLLNHLELSLLLVSRLKLNPLATLLRQLISRDPNSNEIALVYISQYLECQRTQLLSPTLSHFGNHFRRLLTSLDSFLDGSEWSQCEQLADLWPHRAQAQLARQLIAYERAMQLELEEEFANAIECHHQAGTIHLNVIRLALKRQAAESLTLEHLFERDSQAAPLDHHAIFGLPASSESDRSLIYCTHELELERDFQRTLGRTMDQLPPGSRKLLQLEAETLRDQNRLKYPQVSDWAKLLTNEQKAQLIELTNRPEMPLVSSRIILIALDQYSPLLFKWNSDQIDCKSIEFLRDPNSLLDLGLDERKSPPLATKDDASSMSNQLAHRLLKWGLLEESLRLFIASQFKDRNESTSAMDSALDWLNESLERSNMNTETTGNDLIGEKNIGWQVDELDWLDPEIGEQTIGDLCLLVQNSSELISRSFHSQSLAFVILCLQISLQRVQQGAEYRLAQLERLADHLCRLVNLDQLQIDCSERLLRATASLLQAAKLNFEHIRSSERVRDSLRLLVDSIAGKCLMESRYKQAASLYGQIEDHVSALKALMRTGELELVLQFALLVKDVAVHRLALNYLRHLKAPPETIELFERRSKLL